MCSSDLDQVQRDDATIFTITSAFAKLYSDISKCDKLPTHAFAMSELGKRWRETYCTNAVLLSFAFFPSLDFELLDPSLRGFLGEQILTTGVAILQKTKNMSEDVARVSLSTEWNQYVTTKPKPNGTETFEKLWVTEATVAKDRCNMGCLFSFLREIPASEACCERAFSTLKFVVGKYRASLSEESVSDLIMVRDFSGKECKGFLDPLKNGPPFDEIARCIRLAREDPNLAAQHDPRISTIRKGMMIFIEEGPINNVFIIGARKPNEPFVWNKNMIGGENAGVFDPCNMSATNWRIVNGAGLQPATGTQ